MGNDYTLIHCSKRAIILVQPIVDDTRAAKHAGRCVGNTCIRSLSRNQSNDSL